MAAKDYLNEDLFHGTGGEIKGGVVKPGKVNAQGYGAYSTTSLLTARLYAQARADQEGRLFGTVYRVKPVSKDPKIVEMIPETEHYVIDPKGLEVVEAVDYPINIEAVPGKRSKWE